MSHSTARPEEVAKFDALAQTWWDPLGPMAPLHKMNPLRCQWIVDRLASSQSASGTALNGLNILDVGCGAGLASEVLALSGAAVTGIDAAEEALAIARQHAQASGLNIDYRPGAPEDLAREGLVFDAVVALEVIEHVSNRPVFLAALAELLPPGGKLFLSTMNRTTKAFLTAKVGAEYVLRWLPRGTHDWRQFVTPAELGAEARSAGFIVEDISGMTFNGRMWTASQDVTVNYIAALRRC